MRAESPEAAKGFLRKAKIYARWADVQIGEESKWVDEAVKGHLDLIDSINFRFAVTKAPASQAEARQRALQLEEQK